MKTTNTTRVRAYLAARRAYDDARETDLRAATALRRIETDLRAADAADLDRIIGLLEAAAEAATEAAAALARTRAAYLDARSALRAADLPEYMSADRDALLQLCAASVSRAADRRSAESGADAAAIRARYARLNSAVVLSRNADLMNADAVQEAADNLLAAVLGDPDHPERPAWIDGEPVEMTDRETGEPVLVERPDLPLAYVAARSAGRALDRVMYADGGHAVKMTTREAREAYRHAAELAPLADRADLLQAEADADPTPEKKAAARDARAEYMTAARSFAAAAVVVETRRTVDPIGPGPESALIESERIERVLAAVTPALRANAAAMARAVYEGADTLREAADAAGLNRETGRRAWAAARNAAAVILAEDGETRDLERMIESDERTRAAMGRRRADAAESRAAAALAARAAAPAAAPAPETVESWTAARRASRPERLAATARITPAELASIRDLARALFHGLAE